MQAALKVRTTVLPGNRIEVADGALPVGDTVGVIIMPRRSEENGSDLATVGALDYVRSLTPVQRTAEEWAAIERELEDERDSWNP